MPRLILVRHAKSAWGDPDLADFDRPLAKRGRAAATWIGETLARRGLAPDRILCSTARRTRETLQLALDSLPRSSPPDIAWCQELYDLRDEGYLEFAAARGGDAGTLMLVGHNPATAATAVALAAERTAEVLGPLLDFPTGGIAVIDFDIAAWSQLRAGTGRLVDFLHPPKA